MCPDSHAIPDTIPALVAAAVAAAPNSPALHYQGATLSYRELDRRSRRVAGGLRALGIGPGDRVALWLPNTPAYLLLCIACARLGAIAVALNTRYRAAEIEDTVGRTEAKVLVLWPGFRGIDFPGILADVDAVAFDALESVVVYREVEDEAGVSIGGTRTIAYDDLEAHTPSSPPIVAPETGCSVFTTSGTTRAPKFVLHSHKSIALHASDVSHGFRLNDASSVTALALPLGGVFGFASAMGAVAAAKPIVLLSTFDPESMISLMDRYGVTQFNATDDMVAKLLDAAGNDETFRRVGLVGFAAFNAALDDIVERADARGLRLVGLWGMSEMQALVARRDPDASREERSKAGGELVSASARARVRDPESGRLLRVGEIGELEITGPSQMRGYFQNAKATDETVTEDGFVRTGDLAVMEPDGGFEFLSRMGDVLRLGGFLVSPAEIEGELKAHPCVTSAQVVSTPTASGERAVAFVIARPEVEFDPNEVQAHCARKLAKYKVPARVVALDEFPVTVSANGVKIQRAKLRELAAEVLQKKEIRDACRIRKPDAIR